MLKQVKVRYRYDAAVKRHCVYSDDVPGMVLETGALPKMYDTIPAAAEILMKLNKGVNCRAKMVDTLEEFKKRAENFKVRPVVFVVNLEIK